MATQTKPAPRFPKLASVGGIRRECGKLYRESLNGTRDTLDAVRLATLLRLLADLIQGNALEQRLEALERVVHVEESRETPPKPNGGVIRHAVRP